jgi:two-component system OmpR family sensor kinase
MTLRLRLTIYWAAVFTLLLTVAGLAVFLLFQRQQWARLDGALLEEADTAAQVIGRTGIASAQLMVTRLASERDLGPLRRVLIISGGATLMADGDPSASMPLIKTPVDRELLLDSRDRHFRYALAPFILNGRSAYLVDGVDSERVREPIHHLRLSLLLILPIILLISVSAGYWFAGRALLPMLEVTAGLAEIKPRELSRRLPVPPRDDEVGRLIAAINALLERVERAAEAERRFAADAAHELRTPLTLLRSGIELALHRPRSGAEYAEALEAALRDTVTLGAMADDLLALARLDQERTLASEPIAWSALTAEVIAAGEPFARAKHLTLCARLTPELTVAGNRHHLRRVLNNLLANAFAFTPEAGLVEVGLQKSNGDALLRIADSGPGVPETELPFIFDRFFRGRAGREAGSGLGLSLCREIIQLHGGELVALNRAEGGAEFRVTLPLLTGNLNVC